MSVHGESFWLDKRVPSYAPLAPALHVDAEHRARNGEPFMAMATPEDDNRNRAILQGLLNVIEFSRSGTRICTRRSVAARADAALLRLVRPHSGGFNELNLESDFPMRSSTS